NGMAAVKKDDMYFYIDTKGKKLKKEYAETGDYRFVQLMTPLAMTKFSHWPQEEFEENGKKGLRDSKTKQVLIPCIYDGFYNITHKEQITVEVDGKYGVIDFTGKTVIPVM